MSTHIFTELNDGCLRITLARPEKKNSLTREMYSSLRDAMHDAEHRDDIRVVLLRGHDDFFCAGNDLGDFLEYSRNGGGDRTAEEFLLAIARLSKPLVAAVNGLAIGIGVTMLLHTDIVVAGRNASFQTPFVNLGLCAEGGSSLLMPARFGYLRAARLLLLGEQIDAETALDFGLVTRVCETDRTHAEAEAIIARMLALPATSLQATKRLMRMTSADAIESTMQEELHEFRKLLTGPAAREAAAAFLEKRAPDFSRLA